MKAKSITKVLLATCTVTALIAVIGCSKKGGQPAPPAKATIKAGTYKIIKDEGSDNGDDKYYTRTLTVCEVAARFTFDQSDLELTSPCTSTVKRPWTYDSDAKILTFYDFSGFKVTAKVESLEPEGLILNEILTSSDNVRYTLQVVN